MLDAGAAAALWRHGIRARTVAYCEREASACAVLRSRMEDAALEPAPVWGGDLEQFPAAEFHGVVDGVVAGFPCQPHSVAGKRRGRDDERNLLPAILRIADAAGAWILFLENVAGLKREFGYIASLLLQRGWSAEWGTLRASDAGASHRRDRWFCVAYREHFPGSAKRLLESRRRAGTAALNGPVAGAPGGGILADGPDFGRAAGARRGGAGHLVLPAQRGLGTRCESGRREFVRRGGELGDAPGQRRGERRAESAVRRGRNSAAGPSLPIFAPGPADPVWHDILSACPWLAPALPDEALRSAGDQLFPGAEMEAEPSVHGVADGLASGLVRARADMLRIAGNGVVPWQAECAFGQLIGRIAE